MGFPAILASIARRTEYTAPLRAPDPSSLSAAAPAHPFFDERGGTGRDASEVGGSGVDVL